MRIVLDTNVLVSAAIVAGSVPHRALRICLKGEAKLILSEQLFAELRRTLGKKKLSKGRGLSPDIVARLLATIGEVGEFVALPADIPRIVVLDPDDDIVLETALTGKADYIVTGDEHLLALSKHKGIPIITPRDFTNLLETT